MRTELEDLVSLVQTVHFHYLLAAETSAFDELPEFSIEGMTCLERHPRVDSKRRFNSIDSNSSQP